MHRYLVGICCLLLLLLSAGPVVAEEVALGGELTGYGTRLAGEGVDFITTPFSLNNGNLFWTVGIAGAIGLTYAYDTAIHDKLQGRVRSRGMDRASDAGSLLGDPYLHLGVAALVYGGGMLADSPKWKETGEMLVESLALADAATLLIKEGTGRGRPVATAHKGDFKPFGFKNDYDSFPSLHTASSFALASVLARTSENIPVAVLSYTAATFVGFSRMYQNKHWASDILLGAAIGELSGRVVTGYHASHGGTNRLVLLPAVSNGGATMNLLYRF